FQEGLYQRVERAFRNDALRSSAGVPPAVEWASRPLPGQQDAAATRALLGSFPEFLSLVEEIAPARLAQVARELRGSDPNSWANLFTQCWTHIDSPTDPQEFLVLAFFQPYAEFARSQAPLQLEGYT